MIIFKSSEIYYREFANNNNNNNTMIHIMMWSIKVL